MNTNLKLDRREIDTNYKRISIKDFREHLADALNFTSVQRKPIVLTKNGEERVGLVPLEYVWFIDQLSKKIDIDWLVLKNRTTEMMWEEIKSAIVEINREEKKARQGDLRDESSRSNRRKSR